MTPEVVNHDFTTVVTAEFFYKTHFTLKIGNSKLRDLDIILAQLNYQFFEIY